MLDPAPLPTLATEAAALRDKVDQAAAALDNTGEDRPLLLMRRAGISLDEAVSHLRTVADRLAGAGAGGDRGGRVMASHRSTLCDQRAALRAIDKALTPAALDVESDEAASLIARARALARAADQMLTAALRHRLDAGADMPEMPETPETPGPLLLAQVIDAGEQGARA